MLFSLIALLILGYALFDFKKAFMGYLVFKIFLDINVRLYLLGASFMTLDYFMSLCFILLFFVKKDKLKVETKAFPYKTPFILLTISFFISSLFAYIGTLSAMMTFVAESVQNFAIIWLSWLVVKDKNDILFLLKWLTFVFLFSVVYAIFEKFTMTNPIFEYKLSTSPTSLVVDSRYLSQYSLQGRGYRVQSFFRHAIGAGVNWGLYFTLVLLMVVNYRWKESKLALITAVLCIPCIFFTNSRSCLLFLFISCLSYTNFKNRRFQRIFIIFALAVVLILPFLSEYTQLLKGLIYLFDSDVQGELGGSSVEGREAQLAAVLGIWHQSPIWGFGYGFSSKMGGALVESALGFESIWFTSLTTHGLLGATSYIILLYYSVIKLPLKYKSWSLLFVSLAYWLTISATTTPGLMEHLYYLILFIIIKAESMPYTLNRQQQDRKLLR